MRVLAFLALLAAPAVAFVPRMPAPVRARTGLTLRFSGEYSEKVQLAPSNLFQPHESLDLVPIFLY